MMQDPARKPNPIIRHTVSGGHSVDLTELLSSPHVRKVIAQVAKKHKVTHPEKSRRAVAQETS